jgi:O-antigen/teichoic acid export membrane protein
MTLSASACAGVPGNDHDPLPQVHRPHDTPPPGDLGATPMDRLHRSIFFAGVERYGSALCFMLSTAILSRLLRPAEFGICAAAIALTALITACSQEFGGANYLIQKSTLSEQDIRTAFTITFCMSLLLGTVLFTLRGAVASFYSEAGLKTGIAVFGAGFLLMPFSVTLTALLRREMAFDTLARCNLTAALVTAATSIVLVELGWSFLGPLTGSIVGHVTAVAMLMSYRRDFRIFRPRFAGWRDVTGFGAYSSAVVIINVFYQSAPQLILGRVVDFTAVGLYGRAGGTTQLFDRLFLGVLNPVIMPAIAAQQRAGADLKRLYLQAVELLTAAQWPFLAFIALMAEPIVRIWFGAGWLEVVPLVRMLCLASLSQFAACLTYPVLVAVGRVRDTLISSLISLPPSLLVIFAASFFGVKAVAASALLTLPFQTAVAIHFIRRRLSFGVGDLLRATRKSSLVTACSCAGVTVGVAINHLSLVVSPIGFLAGAITGMGGWCLGLIISGHPLLAHLRSLGRDIPALLSSPGLVRRSARKLV